MAGFRFHLNPRAAELADCCAVLNGYGTLYEVNGYRTTLSVKSVVQGAARYETPQGHFLVTPDSFLILNHDQRYSMQFEGRGRLKTETLCPFFQPGFLPLDFCERLYPKTGEIGRALSALHAGLSTAHATTPWLEDRMYDLAHGLTALRESVSQEAESFPGRKLSTRIEMYRRLFRGRDFLLSCYGQPLTVADAASVAALSPFHFQRLFKQAFGRTPMQFLQHTRLSAARHLLAHSGDDITTICFAVGFESLGSFSWLFRKRFGVSPRAFRQNGDSKIRRIEEVFPAPLL